MTQSTQPLVFVTGATGFLGAHLVRDLVSHGYRVRALVRNPGSEVSQDLATMAELIAGDVLAVDAWQAQLAGCQGVFHCAGKVSRRAEDALEMQAVHVEGTHKVLAAAKAARIPKVVVAGTSGVVAMSTNPDKICNEDDPTPLSLVNRFPYYRSKLYAEQLAFELCDDSFAVMSVNPSLLLGPGDRHGSSTKDVQRYLENPMPVSPTGGTSFVDARDAAAGMRLAFERGKSGERYLLGSCNCSFHTFFGRIARLAGMSPPAFAIPRGALARKAQSWIGGRARALLGDDGRIPDAVSIEMSNLYWYLSAAKAEQELGWTPREPMVTLRETIEDLRQRGKVPLLSETT